ncbi:PD-(D/E)XK nuclease-like domain-containing protein [Nocardioides sp. BYT-33-1]|uniref:PD-(D/E)XK nuclease-like domain-containing protein n=1 Tax=Nocardioides sp. BYT-33-1 TaxID=3416952 RepID=UPI003F52C237
MSINRDLSEADYHRDTEHLSASGAKVLLGKRPPAEDSDAIQFGRLVHTVILEPEKLDRYAVLNADVIGVKKDGSKATNPKNTDAWREAVFKAERDGLIVIDGRTLAKAQALADAVTSHPEAGRLLAAAVEHEVSMFAEHPTGAPVRGRLDLLGPDFVADIKTCRDGNPEDFGRVMDKLMYHVSAANYIDLARANGYADVDRFDLICVETEPTLSGKYRVSVLEVHGDAIDKGRDLMAEACSRWLANGRVIDLPDYGDGRHVVDLPPWAYDNDFEDIQIGGAA